MTNFSKSNLQDEDGYELWLRYQLIDDANLLESYQSAISQVVFPVESPTAKVAKAELLRGLQGLLEIEPTISESVTQDGALVCVTPQSATETEITQSDTELEQVGDEGFVILSTEIDQKKVIMVMANTDIGILYGAFHLLRLIQTHQSLENLSIISAAKIQIRILNHWDNLDGTIERGYAGNSLWDWHKLPHYVHPRYTDYARACASIGINATVLTNVNANALILTDQYLHKVKVLADLFRPYGIKVFLTARFSAPLEMGGLSTADPLDADVVEWWQKTVKRIYAIIPDFGGFVVKANSEGQPGPHDYDRTHADGANLLADALSPYNGMLIWRAFVYSADVDEDRAKQANTQLVPLDGEFHDNVLLQVKNGPIDFQPREPYHPLFGTMPQTPLMLEVQITQEYLGCATHLVYLAPLFKETLDADTYCNGEGSTVAKVVDGSLNGHSISGMAGVTNIGNDRNWCGHPFAASSWYSFGRLAWDYDLSAEAIANEWLRMTFSNQSEFVETATEIMITSREAVVEYMMPLGLHHIFEVGHHYGPGPWIDMNYVGRADWSAVYYHQADEKGIGFDRTQSGSDAVSLYNSPYCEELANLETCPEKLLLWFHHLPWDYKMKSGRTLWEELCFLYNRGVQIVRKMQQTWESLAEYVDSPRFIHVKELLRIQEREARWWRDACLLYFQTFSGMPIPDEYEQPEESLEYYIKLKHHYVPGIPERRFDRIG